jgi:hypothetical protein
MTSPTIRFTAIAFAGSLLVGCASTPTTNSELESARTQYEAARANAEAQKFASEELDHAERLLASADAAFESREDDAKVDHLAYLSNQSSRTAVAIGEAKAAEERVSEAATERERIRLAARTREAENARAEAEIATHEARSDSR